MRTSRIRILTSLLFAALLAPALAACAVVGGGGDAFSDCESDVSGSEVTPVATADYFDEGDSCNNNAFVDTDLDAFAYPAANEDSHVGVFCKGDGASWRLYDVTGGVPNEINSGDCDGEDHFTLNVGERYVLVIEYSASSEGAGFSVWTEVDP
jgi:hypothetical protein